MKQCHLEICKGDDTGFCVVCKHISGKEYTCSEGPKINYFYAESLPSRYHDGMERYLNEGIDPGGFLTACLENNLSESYARADVESKEYIPTIVFWLYNSCPSPAWGSPEKVKNWASARTRERIERLKNTNCQECLELAAQYEGVLK